MKLKSIPKKLAYIVGAQWTRDIAWTIFTILLARHSSDILGQIVLALTYGYLVKTIADVGLNDFLLSSFARGEVKPKKMLAEVTWLKLMVLFCVLLVTWQITLWQNYALELQIIVLSIAAGLGLDAVADSYFALCQARGRQDVEMKIRIPAALLGLGYGIIAVLLELSPLAIALFKPLEALASIIFCLISLGENPLARQGRLNFLGLFRNMKEGIIFTGMAAFAMFYNKINVIFLKRYGGNEDVGGYGVAWETIEGLSVLISSALLGKVIFPLLTRLWEENRAEFHKLASRTALTLWGVAMPVIYIIWVESDRFLPFIYGDKYQFAIIAQKLLTPCLATAFLHNLAAYAMIGMRRQKLLFIFYASGMAVNLICCLVLIPIWPLPGAALTLTITKVWVALLTVGFFQYASRPLSFSQWSLLLVLTICAFGTWNMAKDFMSRDLAEILGLLPLLLLFWLWKPPSLFEKRDARPDQ